MFLLNRKCNYDNSSQSKGFTLIEIVIVLVLIGILSAVAVPKYFDLTKQAEQKAMQTIVAEFSARFNGHFASNLLNGEACDKDTIFLSAGTALTEMNPELADHYEINQAGDLNYPGHEWNFKITSLASRNTLDFTLSLPICSKN